MYHQLLLLTECNRWKDEILRRHYSKSFKYNAWFIGPTSLWFHLSTGHCLGPWAPLGKARQWRCYGGWTTSFRRVWFLCGRKLQSHYRYCWPLQALITFSLTDFQKNASAPVLLRALTGVGNVGNIGQILSVDSETKLNFWKSDECNEIRCNESLSRLQFSRTWPVFTPFRGTDGSVFHPSINKSDVLRIFNKDLCRSLPLIYQEDVVTNGGIPGYRYKFLARLRSKSRVRPLNWKKGSNTLRLEKRFMSFADSFPLQMCLTIR